MPGTGAEPRAERAGFALWDPHRDVEVWHGDLGLPVAAVIDLFDADGSLTYAMVQLGRESPRWELLLLDLIGRRIVSRAAVDPHEAGRPLEVSFQADARYLYGASDQGVYRVRRATTDMEMLWKGEGDDRPTAGGAVVRGAYYFAANHRLRAAEVGQQP